MAFAVEIIKPANRKYYQCRWIDPISGRKQQRSTGSTTMREAERFAARLEDEIQNGTFFRDSNLTIAELEEIFIEKHAGRMSKSHVEQTQKVFSKLRKLINPKLAKTVTTPVVKEFRRRMEDSGLAPATVVGYLKQLGVVYRWAREEQILRNVPIIKLPKIQRESGGRPLTGEEFERMLAKCDNVHEQHAKSWKFLLRGLWLSGLRIGEAMQLSWDADADFRVELSGKYPAFWIASHLNKSRKQQEFPMSPEFYEFVMAVPEEQRIGYVFNPVLDNGRKRANKHRTMKGLGAVGKAANIVTKRTENGKTVFASGHDMRRSFGYRWASKVMPAVLKTMMRHGSIETTMKYYVDNSRDQFGDAIWGTTEKHEPRDTFSDTTSANSTYKAQKQKSP